VTALEALADKYREMIALRRDDGPRDDARLRALATRFPGALRELDTRTMASLEQRLAELGDALAGARPPAWADVQLRFHGWLRVGLAMRRDGIADAATARTWARSYVAREPGDPEAVTLDDAALALLLAPPRGRLSLAACALLGDVDDLDALLFG
jgi:hypothetical protein